MVPQYKTKGSSEFWQHSLSRSSAAATTFSSLEGFSDCPYRTKSGTLLYQLGFLLMD